VFLAVHASPLIEAAPGLVRPVEGGGKVVVVLCRHGSQFREEVHALRGAPTRGPAGLQGQGLPRRALRDRKPQVRPLPACAAQRITGPAPWLLHTDCRSRRRKVARGGRGGGQVEGEPAIRCGLRSGGAVRGGEAGAREDPLQAPGRHGEGGQRGPPGRGPGAGHTSKQSFRLPSGPATLQFGCLLSAHETGSGRGKLHAEPCLACQEGLGNFYNRQSSLCFHTSPYLNPDMWPSRPSCPELLQLPHL
jgi:hypothetical protein